MPIVKDGSLLDATDTLLIGFGEVKLASNQDGLPHYVSQTVLPSVFAVVTALIYIVRAFFYARSESEKSKTPQDNSVAPAPASLP